ncbi:MAG: acetylornithine deacetylase [Rhodobacteraceae bacterium]|nr:acetylornithine deacetylase [Paracoccaceae bacterium]MCC0046179.1 acetylornithine deacetylase [Defluviimonas sp.]MCB2131900.1 acetylornithine deacetylase [Paracoccaceae bacterium]MCB2139689.1 acetylornithine deacetylase [Paracoccaceae bacterium]MCB2144678.1 acetylornithine deacetylase [Paracoccaceae bacterium]
MAAELEQAARRILDRLVSFPTVSRDTNLPLIDWVEDYLADLGVASHRVWNADRTKASLYASVGPDVAGGVVLSGHTDVVPVDGQDWSSDPWTVTERDGRLYGRGTCDMKGFVALALAAVPLAQGSGVRRPLQIALSYDEEVGCTGCIGMVEEMAARLPRAAAVIVGEPSRMKVVTGHKGGGGFHVHVRGFEVHSSIMNQGVSAIMEAARLIGWANDRNAENAAKAPGPLARAFDPPWTTVHVGKIAGGTAHNITAGDCRMGVDFRVVPGEDVEAWLAAFEAEASRLDAGVKVVRPEAGVDLRRFFTVPALVPETDGAAEALARRLTGDNATHVVSYGTEAGHFQKNGYSCVVCGPGDIAQAHQRDEYIELSEFRAGAAFMENIVAELCK